MRWNGTEARGKNLGSAPVWLFSPRVFPFVSRHGRTERESKRVAIKETTSLLSSTWGAPCLRCASFLSLLSTFFFTPKWPAIRISLGQKGEEEGFLLALWVFLGEIFVAQSSLDYLLDYPISLAIIRSFLPWKGRESRLRLPYLWPQKFRLSLARSSDFLRWGEARKKERVEILKWGEN